MDWFALTLVCAFSLASADAATKAWLTDYSAAELTVVRLSLPGLLLSPLLVGMPNPLELPAAFWGWMALSVPLEIVAMVLYMAAIRAHALSLTLPYLAFTPAFVMLLGWLLLGEAVSPGGMAGVLLIVAGAWLLNLDDPRPDHPRAWLAPFQAMLWAPGARLMLIVALVYALTAVTGKAAMGYLGPRHFGAFYFAVLGVAVLPLVLVRSPLTTAGQGPGSVSPGHLWQRLSRRPFAVLAVGALMALMIVTHFLAIERVEAVYMIAVKRTSLVFGILYGAWLFHERGLATRLPAGLLMLAGVAVILLI